MLPDSPQHTIAACLQLLRNDATLAYVTYPKNQIRHPAEGIQASPLHSGALHMPAACLSHAAEAADAKEPATHMLI
jgi:hypothetical protein